MAIYVTLEGKIPRTPLRLNGKKITNTVLDQIPRKDMCDLLFDDEEGFIGQNNIKIICRFSLIALLNSERRIFKAQGHDARYIGRLMDEYHEQDGAILFTFNGQLFCDSFSAKTGTAKYGLWHSKLEAKISSVQKTMNNIGGLLKAHEQGVDPIEITKELCKDQQARLPTGLPRRKKSPSIDQAFSEWDETIKYLDVDIETLQQYQLDDITEKYGSWAKYIKSMQIEFNELQRVKTSYQKALENYEKEVSMLIDEVLAKPLAVLGI